MTHRQPVHTRSHADDETEDEFHEHSTAHSTRGALARRLLLDLLGRWYWIALGAALGILVSTYYLSKAPNKYSATSTILIKEQTNNIISRDRVDDIDMRSIEALNTAAEVLRRHDLLERVASRIDVLSKPGLMPPPVDYRPDRFVKWWDEHKPGQKAAVSASPPTPSDLANLMASRMNVSIRRGTRLVDITFEHEVPEIAKTLADAVVREYLAELAGAVSEGRTSQSRTLEYQSEEVRKVLLAAESALATYNRAIELHKSLETQENTASQLARRYLPKHPKMITANSELQELKTRFLNEFDIAIRSPADQAYWQTASAQIEAAQGDIDARLRLARQLLLARTGVLQGEITSQMAVFNAMITRLEESNINRQGDEANVEISSLARVPYFPSFPNRNKTRIMGLGGGGMFGLAIAFLLVRINNKFHSVAQIEEETNLPVLAAISVIKQRHLNQATRAHFRKHKAEEPNRQRDAWDPHLIFRPSTSSTIFAEMIRILRASVSLLGDEEKNKVTLFSSSLPGEGKSFVSANFALAAAGQGRKTLLIDLDLRKPSIHRLFGILSSEQGSGITDWLTGKVPFDDMIHHKTGCENLDIILSGHRVHNPGEILRVSSLKQLLSEACEKYDVVVVDSAPLLSVPDTRVIAPLADNFCLVVRADYVPRGAVARTLNILGTAGTPPSGLVFNGFKETRRMLGENYSYGSYRLSSYGKPYQYGYGSYGAYGAEGTIGNDDSDKDIVKRLRKSARNRFRVRIERSKPSSKDD